MRHFIEPEWLAAVQGGHFYYPASGDDIDEPIRCFSKHVRALHFCDIRYRDLEQLRQGLRRSPSSVIYRGPRVAEFDYDWPYRRLVPGKRIEVYDRRGIEPLLIVRRRGFGEMGLAEFPAQSISIFMHRGDGMGEGGSGVLFLADYPRRHPPLSHLYSKLQQRLCDSALVISDGSNARPRFFRQYQYAPGNSKTGEDAYREQHGRIYRSGDFAWTCVGWLSYRYGPTLVWGGSRIRSSVAQVPALTASATLA